MQTVKAVKALPGHQEGAVFELDEDSAAALEERGDVEYIKDSEAPEAGGLFVQHDSRRSGASIVQVAEADYPTQHVVGEPADGDDGEPGAVVDGDGVTHTELVGPSRSSNKSDLVAFAVANGFTDEQGQHVAVTEAQAEELTKPELVAKLGL